MYLDVCPAFGGRTPPPRFPVVSSEDPISPLPGAPLSPNEKRRALLEERNPLQPEKWMGQFVDKSFPEGYLWKASLDTEEREAPEPKLEAHLPEATKKDITVIEGEETYALPQNCPICSEPLVTEGEGKALIWQSRSVKPLQVLSCFECAPHILQGLKLIRFGRMAPGSSTQSEKGASTCI
jgi:hypothetical protein